MPKRATSQASSDDNTSDTDDDEVTHKIYMTSTRVRTLKRKDLKPSFDVDDEVQKLLASSWLIYFPFSSSCLPFLIC